MVGGLFYAGAGLVAQKGLKRHSLSYLRSDRRVSPLHVLIIASQTPLILSILVECAADEV